MSIASEIARLQQAKADLKTAINAKGQSIDDETIDEYADFVAAIEVGGGGTGDYLVRFIDYDGTILKEEYVDSEDNEYVDKVLNSLSKEMKEKFEFRLSKQRKMFKAVGCEKCNFTGYSGVTGVFEILPSDSEIEGLIVNSVDVSILRKELLERSLNLEQDGVMKVISGETSLDEIKRVL